MSSGLSSILLPKHQIIKFKQRIPRRLGGHRETRRFEVKKINTFIVKHCSLYLLLI